MEKKRNSSSIWVSEYTAKVFIICGLCIVLIGLLIFGFREYLFNFSSAIKSDKIGQLGDFVGGISGSMWALAGVILFYKAMNYQRDDLKTNKDLLNSQNEALQQQIKEFKSQKEELQITREVYKEQSKTFKLQQFESTFFNLLNIIHRSSENIETNVYIYREQDEGDNVDYVKGLAFFTRILEAMRCTNKLSDRDFNLYLRRHSDNTQQLNTLEEKNDKEYVQWRYEYFYKKNGQYLGHFCRMVYHLFKITIESFSEEILRNKYISIIQASLSNDQLGVLFYNGISKHALNKNNKPEFESWLNYYNFFENITEETLVKRMDYKFYPFISYKFLEKSEKSEVNAYRSENINNLIEYLP
ncbi:MAG: putative phage abortive infection protein [Desulfobacula sp.]|nr:putative phage abortive infection protein [Desulfobacula sp.]